MGKIAIAALTRGYKSIDGYDELIKRNQLIYDNIVTKTELSFDCILFHEGDITDEHQTHINKSSPLNIVFKNVKECGDRTAFDDLRNIVNMELCPPTELSSRFPLGYKHMCYFWSINLFDYLSEYDYVIRMDEDVFVQEIDVRVLEAIIDQDVKFAVPYICTFLDDSDVMIGLERLTRNFLDKNHLNKNLNIKSVFAPNTNFMILNLNYYRNNRIIQEYLSEIKKSHGIYSNRWGDATIWGIIIYVIQDEPFYLCDDIVYLHGSHNHLVNGRR
jgi:hypothetical protein